MCRALWGIQSVIWGACVRSKAVPLQLFCLVTGLTALLLTAVSSQNISQKSYWVKMSLPKTWQGFTGPRQRGRENSIQRLERVWKLVQYSQEELFHEAMLVPDFGVWRSVKVPVVCLLSKWCLYLLPPAFFAFGCLFTFLSQDLSLCMISCRINHRWCEL